MSSPHLCAASDLPAPSASPPAVQGLRGPRRECGRGAAYPRARNHGAVSLAGLLVVPAAGVAFSARHWLVLAERSRVGARSEGQVQRALAPLRTEGWRLRHSLQWRGRGDIDLVAIAPWGVAFALEVKTSRYEDRHLVIVREQAAWLW